MNRFLRIANSSSSWRGHTARAFTRGTFNVLRGRSLFARRVFSSASGQQSESPAQAAVARIIYNSPSFPERRGEHVLAVLVDNESGLLSKISGMLSARGFNIDSLTASKTDVENLSRITLRIYGPDAQVEQCRRQLEDLVEVWAVIDYTEMEIVARDLVLLKVSTIGRAELRQKYTREMSLRLPHKKAEDILDDGADEEHDKLRRSAYAVHEGDALPLTEGESCDEGLRDRPTVVRQDSLSSMTDEQLLEAHARRAAVTELGKLYGGETVDVGREHVTIQLVSWPRRVDAFIRMLQPFGIIECARTGMVALPRSRVTPPKDSKEKEQIERNVILPPS